MSSTQWRCPSVAVYVHGSPNNFTTQAASPIPEHSGEQDCSTYGYQNQSRARQFAGRLRRPLPHPKPETGRVPTICKDPKKWGARTCTLPDRSPSIESLSGPLLLAWPPFRSREHVHHLAVDRDRLAGLKSKTNGETASLGPRVDSREGREPLGQPSPPPARGRPYFPRARSASKPRYWRANVDESQLKFSCCWLAVSVDHGGTATLPWC